MKLLAWAGVALLTVYLVFIGGAWYGLYLPNLRLTSVVLAGLGLATWAVLSVRRPELRPRSQLTPAIAACLGSLAISTVFSRFRGISLEYLGYAIVLAALYLLLVQLLRDDFFRRRFVALARGLFVAVVVAYLALVVSHWIQWWMALGRLTVPPLRPDFEGLTFGNPSAVLTVVALLAVPVVAAIDWTTRRGVLLAGLVLAAVGVIALFTGSRAGWLALAVAVGLCVVLAAIDPSARKAVRHFFVGRTGIRFSRSGVAIGVAAILVLAVLLVPAIVRRATEGGEANRLTFVQVALRLFAQSPVVGTGPGTWVIQRAAETNAGEIDEYIPHAHNLYAQTLAELGLVGLTAGIVLAVVVGRLLAGALRSGNAQRRRWAWAAIIGLVYFGAHQVLDFYANMPAVLFLAAFPLAYLDATAGPRNATDQLKSDRRGRAVSLAGTVVVGIATAGLTIQEIPALTAQAVVADANAGDWDAESAARSAADVDPRISPYLFTAGLFAARHGDHALAITYFGEVARRDDLPEAWLNLAAEDLEAGQTAEVEPAIRAALRLGSQRPAVAIPAGGLALRAGLPDLAVEALVSGVAGAPSFLADPWWKATASVAGLRDEIAQRAAAVVPGSAWEIALMTGDPAQAHALTANGGADAARDDFIDAWAGDAAAWARLTSRCNADPFDTDALGFCARIASRLGNVELATRFRSLAGTQNIGAARFGTDLRVAGPALSETIDTNLALFWAPFTYRRFAPWDMLVPTLLHLTLL